MVAYWFLHDKWHLESQQGTGLGVISKGGQFPPRNDVAPSSQWRQQTGICTVWATTNPYLMAMWAIPSCTATISFHQQMTLRKLIHAALWFAIPVALALGLI